MATRQRDWEPGRSPVDYRSVLTSQTGIVEKKCVLDHETPGTCPVEGVIPNVLEALAKNR